MAERSISSAERRELPYFRQSNEARRGISASLRGSVWRCRIWSVPTLVDRRYSG
jgi:hypothetical protein